MKYFTVFVILCVTTTLAVPRRRLATQSNRVQRTSARNRNIYGMFHANKTDITNCPYIVSVYSKSYDAIIGSGTILNHNWILVTGYETYGLVAEDLTVRAGSNFSYTDGQEYNVSRMVVNEYFEYHFWSDIALLKTTTKMVYSDRIKRIGLSYYVPVENSTAVISGYGGNEEEDWVLRSSQVTVLNASVCDEYLHDADEHWLCTSSSTSAQSAFDDFGNPLVQNNVLIGVYLGTMDDGPGFFLHIAYWKDWIIDNIKTYNNQ